MGFVPHTQDELEDLSIQEGKTYDIEYVNKDYFNGDETIERGRGVAMQSEGKICFCVTDPFGMDKLVMQVRVLG